MVAVAIAVVSAGLSLSGYRDPLVGAVLITSAPALIVLNVIVRYVNRPRVELRFDDGDVAPWHVAEPIEHEGYRGEGELFRIGLRNPTWRTIRSAVTHLDKIVPRNGGAVIPVGRVMHVSDTDDEGIQSVAGIDLPKRSTRRHVTVVSRFTNGRTGMYISYAKGDQKLEDGVYDLHFSVTSSSEAAGSAVFVASVEKGRLQFRPSTPVAP